MENLRTISYIAGNQRNYEFRLDLLTASSEEVDDYTINFESALDLKKKFQNKVDAYLKDNGLNNQNNKWSIVSFYKSSSNPFQILYKKHKIAFEILSRNPEFMMCLRNAYDGLKALKENEELDFNSLSKQEMQLHYKIKEYAHFFPDYFYYRLGNLPNKGKVISPAFKELVRRWRKDQVENSGNKYEKIRSILSFYSLVQDELNLITIDEMYYLYKENFNSYSIDIKYPMSKEERIEMSSNSNQKRIAHEQESARRALNSNDDEQLYDEDELQDYLNKLDQRVESDEFEDLTLDDKYKQKKYN